MLGLAGFCSTGLIPPNIDRMVATRWAMLSDFTPTSRHSRRALPRDGDRRAGHPVSRSRDTRSNFVNRYAMTKPEIANTIKIEVTTAGDALGPNEAAMWLPVSCTRPGICSSYVRPTPIRILVNRSETCSRFVLVCQPCRNPPEPFYALSSRLRSRRDGRGGDGRAERSGRC